jgi:hypothetical protein
MIVIHHIQHADIIGRCFEYEYSNGVSFTFAGCELVRSFNSAASWPDVDLAERGETIPHSQEPCCARASRTRLLI